MFEGSTPMKKVDGARYHIRQTRQLERAIFTVQDISVRREYVSGPWSWDEAGTGLRLTDSHLLS